MINYAIFKIEGFSRDHNNKKQTRASAKAGFETNPSQVASAMLGPITEGELTCGVGAILSHLCLE